MFQPILSEFVQRINQEYGTVLKVITVPNRFFGEEVTVAGLIAGGDILAAREQIEGEFLIVPEQACLKEGRIFLDDETVEGLEEKLSMPVSHGGDSLMEMLRRAAVLETRTS